MSNLKKSEVHDNCEGHDYREAADSPDSLAFNIKRHQSAPAVGRNQNQNNFSPDAAEDRDHNQEQDNSENCRVQVDDLDRIEGQRNDRVLESVQGEYQRNSAAAHHHQRGISDSPHRDQARSGSPENVTPTHAENVQVGLKRKTSFGTSRYGGGWGSGVDNNKVAPATPRGIEQA